MGTDFNKFFFFFERSLADFLIFFVLFIFVTIRDRLESVFVLLNLKC